MNYINLSPTLDVNEPEEMYICVNFVLRLKPAGRHTDTTP